MLDGIAQGGPLNGVKLSAQTDWNGTVKLTVQRAGALIPKIHPGRYKWDLEANTWVWSADGKGK